MRLRRIILIVATMLATISTVAAVSAFEAHTINVTAHIENALSVVTDPVDFGTVFPEEFLKLHRSISLSTSAEAELGELGGDLVSVSLRVYGECKKFDTGSPSPVPTMNATGGSGGEYYAWGGEFFYVGLNPSQDPMPISGMAVVGPRPTNCDTDVVDTGIATTLNAGQTSLGLGLAIAIDTPVFEGFYNSLTDAIGCVDTNGDGIPDSVGLATPTADANAKPSGLCAPTHIILQSDTLRYLPEGLDVGVDIKVQVTGIVRVSGS